MLWIQPIWHFHCNNYWGCVYNLKIIGCVYTIILIITLNYRTRLTRTVSFDTVHVQRRTQGWVGRGCSPSYRRLPPLEPLQTLPKNWRKKRGVGGGGSSRSPLGAIPGNQVYSSLWPDISFNVVSRLCFYAVNSCLRNLNVYFLPLSVKYVIFHLWYIFSFLEIEDNFTGIEFANFFIRSNVVVSGDSVPRSEMLFEVCPYFFSVYCKRSSTSQVLLLVLQVHCLCSPFLYVSIVYLQFFIEFKGPSGLQGALFRACFTHLIETHCVVALRIWWFVVFSRYFFYSKNLKFHSRIQIWDMLQYYWANL